MCLADIPLFKVALLLTSCMSCATDTSRCDGGVGCNAHGRESSPALSAPSGGEHDAGLLLRVLAEILL